MPSDRSRVRGPRARVLAVAILVAAGAILGTLGPALAAGESGPDPQEGPVEPAPTGQVTVLYDGFEGAFPGSWTAFDGEPANGDDYWGTSTARAYGGARSAWSAAVGGQTRAVSVFEEDFEGPFPGPNWTAGDANPFSGDDYWGTTAWNAFTGSRSAWSAEVGTNSVMGSPNNFVHRYDNGMGAEMTRFVDLTGYGLAIMMYWYWIDAEPCCDFLHVGFLDAGVWVFPRTHTGSTAGSWYPEYLYVPSTATAVGFLFETDGSVIAEGAYVDDVLLYGLPATPLWFEDFEGPFPGGAWTVGDLDPTSGIDHWGATSWDSHAGARSAWSAEVGFNSVMGSPNNVVRQYDNDMLAYARRDVTLAAGRDGILTYWVRLESASGFDFLEISAYDPVSGWNPTRGHSGSLNGWAFDAAYIPERTTQIGLDFRTDGSVIGEGAYVDDVTAWEMRETPNADLGVHDDGMDAWMYRAVDLAGFTSARIEYAYWTDTEVNYDHLRVAHSQDAATWTQIAFHEGSSGGWATASVPIPTAARYVGFHFHSDGSVTYEGAYVDEVRVVGTAPDLTCGATVGAASGTEGLTAFAFTGSASGGVPPYAWSWAFGDGGADRTQSPTYTYPNADGSPFVAVLTVTDDVTQTCTATAGPITVSHRGPLTVAVTVLAGAVEEGGAGTLRAVVRDGANHDVTPGATIAWSVAPAACGAVVPAGAAATLQADGDAGGMACTVTASAMVAGLSGVGTLAVDVAHAGPITVAVAPGAGAVDEGASHAFTATVTDARGHDVTDEATIAWSVAPEGCGTLAVTTGPSTTFLAASGRGGTSCAVTATATLGEDEGSDTAVLEVSVNLVGVLLLPILLLVIVAVVVALALRRRKRAVPPPPAPGAPPAPPEPWEPPPPPP